MRGVRGSLRFGGEKNAPPGSVQVVSWHVRLQLAVAVLVFVAPRDEFVGCGLGQLPGRASEQRCFDSEAMR
tara:strand:- start:900 stop:1112 length:213 start_codon:yes stop_codon:yes gene_type:complete